MHPAQWLPSARLVCALFSLPRFDVTYACQGPLTLRSEVNCHFPQKAVLCSLSGGSMALLRFPQLHCLCYHCPPSRPSPHLRYTALRARVLCLSQMPWHAMESQQMLVVGKETKNMQYCSCGNSLWMYKDMGTITAISKVNFESSNMLKNIFLLEMHLNKI